MKYLLDMAGNSAPYYWQVPQHFIVPAVYFPPPEIVSGGETFMTYKLDYAWYIKIFHKTSQQAYALAFTVLTALKAGRNLIPLIEHNGEHLAGALRLNDAKLKPLDESAAQLALSWRSRRPYNADVAQKMQHYEVEGWSKAELYKEKLIEQALVVAIQDYGQDLD